VSRTALALAAALLILAGWPLCRPEPSLPTFAEVRAAHRPSDLPILDRNGEVVHELRVDATARRLNWVPLTEISSALQAAVIAAEDRRFYAHSGVDASSLRAASWQQIAGGSRRGASTITMQVAALLSPDLQLPAGSRSLGQKWRQARRAWGLERRWSKGEILETYLNRVTFRGELQGVGAAAHVLFGKTPHGLGEAEAIVLAALVRSPNAARAVLSRRALALREAMGGTAGADEVLASISRALDAPNAGPRTALAAHAARHLSAASRAPLGPAPLRSTLDARVQRLAAASLRRQLSAVAEQHVRDGAVLVVDNASGEVLAYVGSSGDLSATAQVDGVRAHRQAGSTLKPFLYGLALERRLLTAASLLDDAPLELATAGGLYRPENYDNRFRGLVGVRTALAGSLNVPAVKVLTLVGADAFALRLRQLGFEGVREAGDFYGPALALGSADVSLWELVNAYRTLANGGRWSALRLAPDPLHAGAARPVLDAQAAYLVSAILADRESRSGTFGLESPLATRGWTAVKTGTSKDMRDNWCVGFSPRYTVGVWVGNFSGEAMWDVSGTTGAAPVWLEVMTWLHRDSGSAPPPPPAGLLARPVRFPGQGEPDRIEWFLQGTEPREPLAELAEAPVRPARIVAPVDGTIIALDPDIPPGRQRVFFESSAGGGLLRWVLDGEDVRLGGRVTAWTPQPGKHRLALVDGANRPIDAASFEVRGAIEPFPD
jgi:penicillin-binding protein 1C